MNGRPSASPRAITARRCVERIRTSAASDPPFRGGRNEVDLAGMRMVVERGREAAEADDQSMVIGLNRKFHDLVNQASGTGRWPS
jgi:DNA-binding GntR family transcriptional regulator